jgi:general secretion pathway protein G
MLRIMIDKTLRTSPADRPVHPVFRPCHHTSVREFELRHLSIQPRERTPQRWQPWRSLQRGFTLIELMVVLVIIGVLAALIVPNVLDRADDARVTAAKTDVNNLMQALKLYRLDNQRYPTGEQGLNALVAKPTTGPVPPNWRPYLDKLPADPWSRPYQYLNPGLKGEVDVLSLGADGQPGGENRDADVGSWQ